MGWISVDDGQFSRRPILSVSIYAYRDHAKPEKHQCGFGFSISSMEKGEITIGSADDLSTAVSMAAEAIVELKNWEIFKLAQMPAPPISERSAGG